MELNITRFFNEAAPMDYSASAAEIGQNAGRDTWIAACGDAPEYAEWLDTEDKRDEFRRYVKSFGAWDKEEIAAWTNDELTALLMQMIAGDIREGNLDTESPDWEAYREMSEHGQISGHIYPGDDGQIYYYIGM
jgi:hypothetical protein